MNGFYLLVLLMCCSCQNRADCANWNERRDAGDNRQQDMQRMRDTDCGCHQMSRQGSMQRYDRELKESAAFDSVPGMEMTDGDPYPVYRETDEVR